MSSEICQNSRQATSSGFFKSRHSSSRNYEEGKHGKIIFKMMCEVRATAYLIISLHTFCVCVISTAIDVVVVDIVVIVVAVASTANVTEHKNQK